MIELADIDLFPVDEVMARLTSCTETAFVEIFVACKAASGEAEISAIQIFRLDRGPFLLRNMGGGMTFVAGKAGMLAFKDVSRLLVVESMDIPLDERKIFAIVFGVATGALLA